MSLVGLLGAHRTGKTTLAKHYAQQNGLNFVETSVSAIFKELGINPKDSFTFSDRLDIQEVVLDKTAEKFAGLTGDVMTITDRTPLDMLAYTLAEAIGDSVPHADQERLRRYSERCFEITNRCFSALILVQPGIAIVDAEGKAAANEAYIQHLSSLMFGLMMDERCSVPHFYIRKATLSLEERVTAVNKCLNRVLYMAGREVDSHVELGGHLH